MKYPIPEHSGDLKAFPRVIFMFSDPALTFRDENLRLFFSLEKRLFVDALWIVNDQCRFQILNVLTKSDVQLHLQFTQFS